MSRCLPAVDAASLVAAKAARAVPQGTRCNPRSGLRLLTASECRAFARHPPPPFYEQFQFIGTQVEKNESPGCVLWNGKAVEFNDHYQQRRGCDVAAKGGQCICTPVKHL